MPAIDARALTKRFRRTEAVRSLDLAVQTGEVFGLIGPDGAGKTTLIRLLAGVMVPTAGTALVSGLDTRSQADRIHQAIGYMPQKFSLYGDLTVAENLSFFAEVHGVPASQKREQMQRLLALARLSEFADRRAAHLSGGMQKKLALACTLVHRPGIILLDEPTTGVDPISRREFWDILSDLHVEGVTLFISTPYMDEAERCSRVGLMYDGQIMRCDRPDALAGLVPGELLAVSAADPIPAIQALQRMPGVLGVQRYGDLLHVLVASAHDMQPRIWAELAAQGVLLTRAEQTRPRVEDAFISLIRNVVDWRERHGA